MGEVRSQEERRGILLVLAGVAICLGLTHGIALTVANQLSPFAWWFIFALIYAEAIVELICLAWLLGGDPGYVARSEANCFPLPAAVESRLRKGDITLDLNNIVQGDDTFCTRCLVWRRVSTRRSRRRLFHHCSICQRCVRDFDHHCGVFGRCIAGTATSGNMLPFVVLILNGAAGWITTVTAMGVGFGTTYGGAIGVAVVGGLLALPALLCLLNILVCRWALGVCFARTVINREGQRMQGINATSSELSEAFNVLAVGRLPALGTSARSMASDGCKPCEDITLALAAGSSPAVGAKPIGNGLMSHRDNAETVADVEAPAPTPISN